MKLLNRIKQNLTKYLVYASIVLIAINFVLLFLPVFEVYQPSYSKTTLFGTTYEGWHKSFAPMCMFIFPLFLPGIPYFLSLFLFSSSIRKKNDKSIFIKIQKHTISRPVFFWGLQIAAIANILILRFFYSSLKADIEYLEKHGAYCNITTFGTLNIVFSCILIVALLSLSIRTRFILPRADKSKILVLETQLTEATEEFKQEEAIEADGTNEISKTKETI